MALDFFAIASYGAYPTPTPTASGRAAYAVTMGLLDTLPAPPDVPTNLVALTQVVLNVVELTKVTLSRVFTG